MDRIGTIHVEAFLNFFEYFSIPLSPHIGFTLLNQDQTFIQSIGGGLSNVNFRVTERIPNKIQYLGNIPEYQGRRIDGQLLQNIHGRITPGFVLVTGC
jgi:hypothetical protein